MGSQGSQGYRAPKASMLERQRRFLEGLVFRNILVILLLCQENDGFPVVSSFVLKNYFKGVNKLVKKIGRKAIN